MAKCHKPYWSQVKKVIRECDIILEVIDARFPKESRNLSLEKIVKSQNKKLIIVLNKADLVPENFVKEAIKELSFIAPCVYISVTKHHGSKNLFSIINKVREGKAVKVGVVGYPNVGKSSIINLLRGHHSAPTSSKPGYTKSIQWIRISKGVLLIDTPGVVPFKGKRNLFLKGAMNIEKAEDPIKVIYEFFDDLKKRNIFDKLKAYYEINVDDNEAFLTELAKKQYMLLKGGVLDLNRAARKIYNDWLKGRLKLYWS